MSFWSFITGTDLEAEQARGDAADAQLAQLNQDAVDRGHWTQSQYDQAEADRRAGLTGDVVGSVQSEFNAGLRDGLSNVTSGIKSTLQAVWTAVPLPIWIAAGVVLFLYLGGFGLVRRALKK